MTFQVLGQVLLLKDDVGVKIGESDDHEEVKDPVGIAPAVEDLIDSIGYLGDPRVPSVNEVAGDSAWKEHDGLGEDERYHARRVDPQRDMGAPPAGHAQPSASQSQDALAVLNRDTSLPLLNEDDNAHGDNRDDEEDDQVPHVAHQERAHTLRHAGHNAAEDDERDAVADALLVYQLSQPDGKDCARRQGAKSGKRGQERRA